MCEQKSQADSAPLVEPLSGQGRLGGSRRRRLWELAHDCHCPVIGVCLPLPALRKILSKKVISNKDQVNDYEMHVGTVAHCTRRTPMSELLHDELDRRYSLTIAKFRKAKTTSALATLWAEAVAKGDVAGALWASLTHPCCTTELHEDICRDIHMIQHQAGACTRLDLAHQAGLERKCAEQEKELVRRQARHARIVADKNAECARLSSLVMKNQANLAGKDTLISALQQDLADLRLSIPELKSKARLKEKNTELAQRHLTLQAENELLRQKLGELQQRHEEIIGRLEEKMATDSRPPPTMPAPETINFDAKTVLCVGGRTGSIATYRKMIEEVGGRFVHHDGGLEDSANLLDASLSAADLVICQTGCIGHSAYWRVKEHCKRTGKQCVFTDNPSASGLARGLKHIAIADQSGKIGRVEAVDEK
jgi:FtsZ-binding cell division protein ZapB